MKTDADAVRALNEEHAARLYWRGRLLAEARQHIVAALDETGLANRITPAEALDLLAVFFDVSGGF